MGEKGIVGDALAASPPGATLIERTTSVVTGGVVGAGSDLADTVRDKAVGAVADDIVEEGRQRIKRDPNTGEEEPPDAAQP